MQNSSENLSSFVYNSQTIASFLQVEQSYTLSFDYFKESTTLEASMRSTLVAWMLQVCEEEQCTNEVFSLSVNLFDRCMAALSGRVEKCHLLLIGIVCLFVASKLRSNDTPLDSLTLVDYTDNAFTLEELLEWELLIVASLNWNLAAVCPNDYLDFFLSEFTSELGLSGEQMSLLRKHSLAFTALCSLDYNFAFYPASMIASACFFTALEGIASFGAHLVDHLAELTQTDVEFVQLVREQVKALFKAEFTSIDSAEKSHYEWGTDSGIISWESSFENSFSEKFQSPYYGTQRFLAHDFKSRVSPKISGRLQRRSTRRSGQTLG